MKWMNNEILWMMFRCHYKVIYYIIPPITWAIEMNFVMNKAPRQDRSTIWPAVRCYNHGSMEQVKRCFLHSSHRSLMIYVCLATLVAIYRSPPAAHQAHSTHRRCSVKRTVAAEWMTMCTVSCSICLSSAPMPNSSTIMSPSIACTFCQNSGCSERRWSQHCRHETKYAGVSWMEE